MNVLRGLVQWFGSRGSRTRKPRSRRLVLEQLEDRLTPTSNVWIGPESGNWSNANYWSLGHVPTSSEDLTFGGPGSANTDSVDDISSLTVQNVVSTFDFTSTVSIGSGDGTAISLQSLSSFTSYGGLVLNKGATLSVTGDVFIYGTLTSTGATTLNAGPLVELESGSVVNVTGSTGLSLSSNAIDNFGTVNIGTASTASALTITGASSTYITEVFSTTAMFDGSTLTNDGNQLDVIGTLSMSSTGSVTSTVTSVNGLEISGTLNSSGRSLISSSGTFDIALGGEVNAVGSLSLSGTITQDGIMKLGSASSGALLFVTGSTSSYTIESDGNTNLLNGSGITNTGSGIQVDGTLTMNGSIITTGPGGLNVSSTGTLDTNGGSTGTADTIAGALQNGGTITFGGALHVMNVGFGLTELSSGTLNMRVNGSTSSSSDSITTTGGMVLAGTIDVTDVGPGGPPAGTYTLLSWQSAYQGTFDTVIVPSGFTPTYTPFPPGPGIGSFSV
jgi:hypothetical protein